MPPVEPAVDLFRRLGYEVSGDGTEFRARRKWRTVHVTVLDADEASSARPVLADGGRPGDVSLRCFVTWKGYAESVHDCLTGCDPDYEWAVVGVESPTDYEVLGV